MNMQDLHERMHGLPGMPDHSEAERLNHRGGLQSRRNGLENRPLHNRPLRSPSGHHRGEPRVLVGWQKAIAAFFARQGR